MMRLQNILLLFMEICLIESIQHMSISILWKSVHVGDKNLQSPDSKFALHFVRIGGMEMMNRITRWRWE